MVLIAIFISCFITALAVNFVLSKNMYCNSNYNRANEYSKLEIDYPEYEVKEIHECSCSNRGPRMAKYVLWNFYLKGKDKVGHQELIIYDEIGKYNIGDKLILTMRDDKFDLYRLAMIAHK